MAMGSGWDIMDNIQGDFNPSMLPIAPNDWYNKATVIVIWKMIGAGGTFYKFAFSERRHFYAIGFPLQYFHLLPSQLSGQPYTLHTAAVCIDLPELCVIFDDDKLRMLARARSALSFKDGRGGGGGKGWMKKMNDLGRSPFCRIQIDMD
ncbi:hypothetical protein T11_17975 [Trichinella zimbabwensis]|uniref:Uncharacterized protein n=1 Tax=Trichinella zimbabwensis TaxID=268475 RepID=A0A0V1GX41_9BILA|nr:hypothetical protein T11_17975 [Trichinella zimbabwensis]